MREGWLTPAKIPPGTPLPPRKPVMSFEELMKDLEHNPVGLNRHLIGGDSQSLTDRRVSSELIRGADDADALFAGLA